MLLGKSTKIVLLLLVTSAAYTAPTVGDNSSNFDAPAPSVRTYAPRCEISQAGELYNPPLSTVAVEFLKPPAAAEVADSSTSAKSLPPVPAAIFLSLSGFLCVSFVKDRRVWMTALAALLSLSHTGLTTLPKFASHIISKKQIQHSDAGGPSLCYVSQLDGSFRPRSELEGSEYIGLLRHLAGIPDSITSLPLSLSSFSLRSNGSNLNSQGTYFVFAQNKYKFLLPQFELNLSIAHSFLSEKCLASGAEQILPYLPAFTSLCLARSPPQIIRESSSLYS